MSRKELPNQKIYKKMKSATSLSAEELKMKMFTHFHKSGSMDKFRTQLRNELVSELFKVAQPKELNKTSTEADNRLLPLQVSNWLVYDHLQRQGYDYTLSTFVSESKTCYPEKFLSIYDILDLFGFNSHTEEYEHINEIYLKNHKNVFLYSFLLTLIRSSFDHERKIIDIDLKKNKTLLTQPMEKNTDKDSATNFAKKHTFDNDVSKGCAMYTDHYNTENIVHTENHSNSHTYQQDLQFFKQKNEREIQSLRQKLLEELDSLHLREHKMRIEFEQSKSEVEREREELLVERNKIKQKQEIIENNFEKEIEAKLKTAEEFISTRLRSKEKELEDWEQNMKDREHKLEDEKGMFNILNTDNDSLKKELKDQKDLNRNLQDKYSSLLSENTNLLKKFDNMTDYTIIKSEVAMKCAEISNLKQEVQSIKQKAEFEKLQLTEKVKKLQQTLNEKEPKLMQAEQELYLLKGNFQTEHSLWNHHKEKLEQEIIISKRLYETVIQRLEEQKEDIQDLHRTIHILHYQLTNKESPVVEESTPKPDSYGFYLSKTSLIEPSKPPVENFSSFNRISMAGRGSSYRTNRDSLNFIADAKKRISDLQHEADAVKQKYSMLFGSSESIGKHIVFQDNSLSMSMKQNLQSKDIPKFSSSMQPNTSANNIDFQNQISSNLSWNYIPIFGKTSPNMRTINTNSQNQIISNQLHSIIGKTAAPLSTQNISVSNQVLDSSIPDSNVRISDNAVNQDSQTTDFMNNFLCSKSCENISVSPQQQSPSTFDMTSTRELSNITSNKNQTKKVDNQENVFTRDLCESDLSSKANFGNMSLVGNEIALGAMNPSSMEITSAIAKEKEIAEAEESMKSLTFNKHIEVIPFEVDLDAAWKRKKSLSLDASIENQQMKDHLSITDTIQHNALIQNEASLIPNNSTAKESCSESIESENPINVTCEVLSKCGLIIGNESNVTQPVSIGFVQKMDNHFDTSNLKIAESSTIVLHDSYYVKDLSSLESGSNQLFSSKEIREQQATQSKEILEQKVTQNKEIHNLEYTIGPTEKNFEHIQSIPDSNSSNQLVPNRKLQSDDAAIVSTILSTESNPGVPLKEETKNPQNVAEQSVSELASTAKQSLFEKSEEKEESLSELSEIKLSCGSDQEQKDDSDFW